MEIIYGSNGINKYISVELGKREYPGNGDGSYVYGMILENDIPYLIRPVMVSVDGQMTLRYDTGNTYVLGNLLCGKKPDGAMLKTFLQQIDECMKGLEDYLLDSDDLVLDPGFMLYDHGSRRLRLLYVPGYGRNVRGQLQSFLEFIMIHFDSRDAEGVRFLYGNYELLKGKVPAAGASPKMIISEGKTGTPQSESKTPAESRLHSAMESRMLPEHSTVSLMPLRNGALKRISISEEDKPFVIGRHRKDTDYSIRTLQISRKHAVLLMHEGRLMVTDCGSGNGTYVNSERLKKNEPAKLEPGDVVSFAGEEFYVE